MEKLPLIKTIEPYLDDLRDRKISGRDVAAALQVSESHLSRTLATLGIKRIEPLSKHREAQKALKKARQEYREQVAQIMPIQQAAKAANCHPRTIKRILQKLKG